MMDYLKIQSIFLILVLLTVGVMNLFVSSFLDSVKYPDVVIQTRNVGIAGIVGGLVLSVMSWLLIFREGSTPGFLASRLINLSTILVLVVGAYSADSAVSLQCDKNVSDSLNRSWLLASLSSVISIVFVLVILLLNGIKYRAEIRDAVKGKLCPPCENCPKPPPVYRVPGVQSVPMKTDKKFL